MRFLVIGGAGAGAAEEFGEDTDALLDFGVSAGARVYELQQAILENFGYIKFWKVVAAVGDVAETRGGQLTRYIAFSAEKVGEAFENEAAAQAELQELQAELSNLVRPGSPIVEKYAGFVQGLHAEQQVIKAAGGYPIQWALHAGQNMCPMCIADAEASQFKVFGPVDGDPWFH
jgi:hypothetical protein